jgi:hypothetical protein
MHGYDELMKYIPKQDFKEWHEKALLEAKKTSLSALIEICSKTKEWDKLSERIISVEYDKLKIVAGRWPDSPETFEKRVRKRWVKQTSD